MLERSPPKGRRGTAAPSTSQSSGRAKCPRHGVYLNSLRSDDADCCLICNVEPL
jgi:hypothetical protein